MEICITYEGDLKDIRFLKEMVDIVEKAKQNYPNKEFDEHFASFVWDIYHQKKREFDPSIGWTGMGKILIDV